MAEKKKILVIEKVHDKGMELLKNHPNFEFEVFSISNASRQFSDHANADIPCFYSGTGELVFGKVTNALTVLPKGLGEFFEVYHVRLLCHNTPLF